MNSTITSKNFIRATTIAATVMLLTACSASDKHNENKDSNDSQEIALDNPETFAERCITLTSEAVKANDDEVFGEYITHSNREHAAYAYKDSLTKYSDSYACLSEDKKRQIHNISKEASELIKTHYKQLIDTAIENLIGKEIPLEFSKNEFTSAKATVASYDSYMRNIMVSFDLSLPETRGKDYGLTVELLKDNEEIYFALITYENLHSFCRRPDGTRLFLRTEKSNHYLANIPIYLDWFKYMEDDGGFKAIRIYPTKESTWGKHSKGINRFISIEKYNKEK